MPLISKKITYDLPDEYLSQTNSLGLTGEYNYEGPDKVYVIIDPKTKKIVEHLGFLPYNDELSREENDSFMEQFSGLPYDYALINIEEDAVLLAAVTGPAYDPAASTLPQKTYTLDGDTAPFYSRPEVTLPSHTIDAYDVEWMDGSWKKPYPWKKPYITKDQLLSALNSVIEQEKEVDTEKFTSTQKTKWASYLSALENVTVKFADYLDTPWMVPFPINPMALDNWSATKGNAFGMDNKAGEQKVEKPEGPVEYVDGKAFRDGIEIDISTVEPGTVESELGNEEEPV
jgi:hypothetical protein